MNHFRIISQKNIYWIILALIITFTVAVRIRLLDVPLERDEGDYAYTAQLMLQGIPPYIKSYSMRLPGLYVSYAVIISLFGQTQQGIHLGLLIINSITIIFIYLLSRFFLSKTGSLVSAATFALLSITYSVLGFTANSEHFVILFAVIGLYILLSGLEKSRPYFLFFSGFTLGIGLFMKQNGIFFIILSIIYITYFSIIKPSKQWIYLSKYLFSFIFGFLLFTGCSLLIIYYIGIFNEFWFWTFEYAREYVSYFSIKQAFNSFQHSYDFITTPSILLWIFIGFGLLLLFIKIKSIKFSFFLLLFSLLSIASICPGFYFRPHYFILLLPCAGILSGISFDSLTILLSCKLKKQFGYSLTLTIFIICFLQSIYLQRNYLFFITPFQISRFIYGSNPFNESLKIADFINKNTTAKDTIAIFGSEPQIFFYSKRHSASGFMYMYPMMEKHKFALTMQKSFIIDLEKIKPKYIIFVNVSTSWLKQPSSHKLIFKYLNKLIDNKEYSLCGLVEIFEPEPFYYWEPEMTRITSRSKNWVGIYKNNN